MGIQCISESQSDIMKFLVLVAVVGVAAAKPQGLWRNAPGGGQYIVTYDNSWEHGVRDTSVEYVRPVSTAGRTGTTYSHADRVRALNQRLNSGLVDLSDELQYQYNLQWAQRQGAQNYYINNSGELFYRPGGAQGGPNAAGLGGSNAAGFGGAPAGGFGGSPAAAAGPAPAGTG